MEFVGFPKIARLSREVIITEKIDGTNGQIYIPKPDDITEPYGIKASESSTPFLVGSRTRWITPDNDNHGFARWCYEHVEELLTLGPGRHYGEWWGSGINRGYGLKKGDKRFSLFNTIRWCVNGQEPQRIETGDPRIEKYQDILPACCSLVPILYRGEFDTEWIECILERLEYYGSSAVKGFMSPEGIVVYHVAGNVAFKKTLTGDEYKGGAKNG